MSTPKLTRHATVEHAGTRADKTLKIVLGTQELHPDVLAALMAMAMQRTLITVAMGLNLSEADVEAVPQGKGTKGKSHSKRLRDVLYRYWEKMTDMSEDFDEVFYPKMMEQIMTTYK